MTRPVPTGIRVIEPPPYWPYGIVSTQPLILNQVMRINAGRYARFVINEVARRRNGSLLLINSFMPVHGASVAPLLRPDVHVYHRADELRSFPSCRPPFIEAERTVLRQADIVVCVSDAVRAGIATDRPDAHVIPNGVSVRRFGDASPDPRVCGLGSPIAILVGTVDRRIDPELLDDVVAAGCTLVVAGPVEGVRLPAGTIYLGPVQPSEIPGLLAAADVGLVPYRTTWPGDVLKTYEYLAAGLPVVASALPCLADLAATDGVVVSSREGFASAVVAVAASDDMVKRRQRRATAARHDWSARVDQMIELIASAAGWAAAA